MGTLAILGLNLLFAAPPALAPGGQTVELGVASGAFFPGERQAMMMPTHSPAELRAAGFGFALRLAYLPFSFVGLEGEAGHVALETKDQHDAAMFAVRGHLLAQLPARFTPFLLGGAGLLGMAPPGEMIDHQRDLALHWGAGLKYFVQPELVVRAEGRHSLVQSDHGSMHQFELLLGMSFAVTRD